MQGFKVLDTGYVALVTVMGGDESIIAAARMSTDGSFRGWGTPEQPGDEKLLRYLWEHKHATPFEFCSLVVEVKAPIFVIREWQRHRTQSYNEMSSRYVELQDECYIPSIERLMVGGQNRKNRQGSNEPIDEALAQQIQKYIQRSAADARFHYQQLLASGLARELARLVLPASQYSRMRVSANLRNWLAFLDLRLAPNAQWEIRQYAQEVAKIVKGLFPRTWELFAEGKDYAAI